MEITDSFLERSATLSYRQSQVRSHDPGSAFRCCTYVLGAAHMHVKELKKALRKDDWQQQWNEVRRMARELARDYYNHHLEQTYDSSTISSGGIIHHDSSISSTIAVPDPAAVPPASGDTEPPQPTTPPPTLSGTDAIPATQRELGLETGTGNELQPEPAPTKQKRAYRARSPRKTTSIVAKGKSTVSFKSDILNQEIIKALRDPDTYTHYKEQGLAEHKHTFLQNAKGSIIFSLKPLENEGWETVQRALSTLGDGCIDTYIATLAIAHEHNGTDQIREPFQISPDDILEVCGKKKSHGSYNHGQRAEVTKHLKTLSQARVIATMPGNPGARKKRGPKRKGEGAGTSDPTVMRAEGALIDLLSFKIGEYCTITGEEVWEKRRIAIGEWVTMIPHFSNQTAIMLRQVLAFSAKNERYQKRLGLYLTFMFRINAKNGGVFKCSMAALLEGAGIVVPREQGQFKEAIEYALQVLKRENVMSNYEQIVDACPAWQETQKEIHERARGWWKKYAAIEWRFSSPDYAREQYRNLNKAPTERIKGTNN